MIFSAVLGNAPRVGDPMTFYVDGEGTRIVTSRVARIVGSLEDPIVSLETENSSYELQLDERGGGDDVPSSGWLRAWPADVRSERKRFPNERPRTHLSAPAAHREQPLRDEAADPVRPSRTR
jgi:hypothetical protein